MVGAFCLKVVPNAFFSQMISLDDELLPAHPEVSKDERGYGAPRVRPILTLMDVFYIVAGLCITAYAIWQLLHIGSWIDTVYRFYRSTPERVERHWFRRRLFFFSYAQSRILAWAGLLVIFFVGITAFLQGIGVHGVLDTLLSGRLILLIAILVFVFVLLYGKWRKDDEGPAERDANARIALTDLGEKVPVTLTWRGLVLATLFWSAVVGGVSWIGTGDRYRTIVGFVMGGIVGAVGYRSRW